MIEDREYVYVSLKDSDYVHAIITIPYYNALVSTNNSFDDIYKDTVYKTYKSPFTFTTLNENLPFKITTVNGFKLNATGASIKEHALTQFHLESINVYKEYNLDPTTPWFVYLEEEKDYSNDFKRTYERFREMCVSPS